MHTTIERYLARRPEAARTRRPAATYDAAITRALAADERIHAFTHDTSRDALVLTPAPGCDDYDARAALRDAERYAATTGARTILLTGTGWAA